MNVDLNISDLHSIKRGLLREELYWRRTKRKIRPAEQAMSIVATVATRQKVEAAIAEWEKKEEERAKTR